MGKKRIIGTEGAEAKDKAVKADPKADKAEKAEGKTAKAEPKAEKAEGEKAAAAPASKKIRRSIEGPILAVQATYNNTMASVTDKRGNVVVWTSAGALGFRGAKKGTPFAAAKVGETLGDKAAELGIKEVDVIVSGVGSGRESVIRGFISKSIGLLTIKDMTPVPHNGPKAKKPRRV